MFEEKEVRKCYQFLGHKEETEIRILDPQKKLSPKSFFVKSEDEFVDVCRQYNGKYNLYCGINERTNNGRNKQNVSCVKTLVIDIDAIRPSPLENPATDAELEPARAICDNILASIEKTGQPLPVKVHSGNGYQLWFAIPEIRINDANRQEIEDKLQLFQEEIIKKFDINNSIDKIGDLPRIIKIWGTLNIKGKESESRIFRVATVIGSSDRIENEILKKQVLELEKEKIPEYAHETLEEIDLEILPPCINYLLKFYENKTGNYWYRIVQLLSSFFMSLGLPEAKTLKIIFDWNQKQEYHEDGELQEIEQIVKRIYTNKIHVPNCEKVKTERGGFPYFGLADLMLCRPDEDCNKCISPIIRYRKALDKKQAKILESPEEIFKTQGQVKFYIQEQPIFYDRNCMWWIWNKAELKWEITDEVDILNEITKITGEDIITPKNRTIILNALKQECRKTIPLPIKPTWIQFRDKIVDVDTGEILKATPDYFVTNPIPWKMHNNNYELTPIMDKIFEEWVGKDYVKTLYQIIAFCLIPEYPIHRMFCFIGQGMNGKSCFLRLLIKFLGSPNVCSTELDTLLISRFEVTRLFKKLLCVMGETNFNELNKTSLLKKLTGQDMIGFEFKNKNPFEAKNYAKIVIATNNLPETTDKTVGFYRRWCILDFPNQFNEKQNILDSIPDEEYESLALKCVILLKELLQNKEFHKEGSLEEREKKYEDKSNPFDKFMKECCNLDNPDAMIWKRDFEKQFNEWCKSNRFRVFSEVMIGKKMAERGIQSIQKHESWMEGGKGGRAWVGIRWKDN